MRPDRRTDGQTDGHGDSSIPPPNFVAGGIKIVFQAIFVSITLHPVHA